MPSAIAIRHVAFEDLGLLQSALEERGIRSRYLEAGVDEISPAALAAADLLVILGGPIGVYEEEKYPLLSGELKAVESWLGTRKPVLGICLGAQLIARALGARVYPGSRKEIGIAPVTLTEAGRQSPLQALAAAGNQVLHWHGDTFDLPGEAELLASTPITPHQAFRRGAPVLGLQFHVETRFAGFERWLVGHACELAAAGIDVARLRADGRRLGDAIEQAGRELIRQWLDAAVESRPADR